MKTTNTTTTTNTTSTKNLKKEVVQAYLELKAKRDSIDQQLRALKEELLETKQFDYFEQRTTLNFLRKEGTSGIPRKFLKLDQTKLATIYKSALGGPQFLKEYDLKLEEGNIYS